MHMYLFKLILEAIAKLGVEPDNVTLKFEHSELFELKLKELRVKSRAISFKVRN